MDVPLALAYYILLAEWIKLGGIGVRHLLKYWREKIGHGVRGYYNLYVFFHKPVQGDCKVVLLPFIVLLDQQHYGVA